MATDTLIQTSTTVYQTPRMVRGRDGTFYAAYPNSGGFVTIAYSTDGGIIWNQVISASSGTENIALAIDSTDAIHVVYHNVSNEQLFYRKFQNLAWGAEETIYGVGHNNFGQNQLDIAVDSSDVPHVAFGASSAQDFLRYSNRSGGSWAVTTLLDSSSDGVFACKIVIDSNDHIYIPYCIELYVIKYVKYTTFWTAPVTLSVTACDANSTPTAVVDSSNNVWVVWQTTAASRHLYYSKYSVSTDTWSAEARIGSETDALWPSISRDASNNLNLLYHKSTDSPTDIYYIQYTGSWSAPTKILNAAAPNAFTSPQTRSCYWPIVGGVNTNIPISGYDFTYVDTITGTPTLRYYSSPAVYPAPQTKNYSRSSEAALPSGDTILSTALSATGYSNVLTQDLIYEDQASADDYAVILFKNKGNASTDVINVSWTGKVSIAPTASPVVLQIYNRNSTTWETLSSNATSGANTPFTLTGTKSTSLSNYYDGSNWVSCRVYQLAQ